MDEHVIIRKIMEHLQVMQDHPSRFMVTADLLDQFGERTHSMARIINAADVFTALPIAMFTEMDNFPPAKRWDTLTVKVEPIPTKEETQ